MIPSFEELIYFLLSNISGPSVFRLPELRPRPVLVEVMAYQPVKIIAQLLLDYLLQIFLHCTVYTSRPLGAIEASVLQALLI